MGGEISSIVLNQMNSFGRVSVCGSISSYNALISEYPKGKILPQKQQLAIRAHDFLAPIIQPAVLMKQLKVEGFIFSRWIDRWDEAFQQNLQWVQEGKVIYKEKVTEGFEKSVDAFIDMLQGGNLGKAVVKIK